MCFFLKGLFRRSYELDKSYDVIISSLGWVYDPAPFENGNKGKAKKQQVEVKLMDRKSYITDNVKRQGFRCDRPRRQVYPSLTSTQESVTSENMYFVGANTHGLDRWRYKASGGFIHGFRFVLSFCFCLFFGFYSICFYRVYVLKETTREIPLLNNLI